METYEKYKPSGIDWIGEVPEHWDLKKIKFCFDIYAGATPKTENPDNWDGDIVWVTPADYKTEDKFIKGGQRTITKQGYDSCNTQLVPVGSIIFSKRAPIGTVALNDVELCTNQGCLSCVPKGTNSTYYYYVMSISTEWFDLLGSGATFKEISADNFSNVKLPFPPLAEQEAIAAYLDARCADIDKVVATQQKRIALLQELKQSEITQAVTRGLNPDARMKDSGVEWIGMVPEHWNIRKIKFTTTIVRGGSPRPIDKYLTTDDEGYNWIKIGDAIKGCKYITSTQQKIKPEGFSATRMVHENDLILSNSMSFGQPYIMKIDGCIHDGWLAFSNYNGIVMDYLYYTLQSHFCATQFGMSVDGGVVKNLNIEKVGDTFISLPPIEEQSEIAEYLDRRCGEIDKQIGAVTKQIELLMEYKQALITEVVTGKRKV